MAGTTHVILTRFNLPSPGAESVVRGREGWLDSRFALFDRYCLPTVRSQTSRDFHWLIYFDPASPAWLVQTVSGHAMKGWYQPIFRSSVSRDELADDIASHTDIADGDRLITTNLDNDDGLSADFVARVQEQHPVKTPAAIYVDSGLIKTPSRLYYRVDQENAFCSVVDSWPNAATCWAEWHNRLGLLMPTVHVAGGPGWLQVVHGGNVSNRARGLRVAPAAHRAEFPALLEDLPDPTPGELRHDLLVGRPLRWLTDTGRVTAKNVVLRVVGKKGLDRVKAAVAHRKAQQMTD